MFGTRNAPSAPPAPERSIRDTLFGDAPMECWPSTSSPDEPWSSFIRARDAMNKGRQAEAIGLWKSILRQPALESRHYAQAWHFLRANGVAPSPEHAKKLLGVVVEVPVESGLDLLAAYPDRSARYYNYTGLGVVWEHPDASLDAEIDALLHAGQQILNMIGPWKDERPAPPAAGGIRLSMLAPSGLHFGQGPFEVLASDPMAKPMVDAAIALMQGLIAKDPRSSR